MAIKKSGAVQYDSVNIDLHELLSGITRTVTLSRKMTDGSSEKLMILKIRLSSYQETVN